VTSTSCGQVIRRKMLTISLLLHVSWVQIFFSAFGSMVFLFLTGTGKEFDRESTVCTLRI